ncbi:interferon-induced GTP-binding protein Mx2 [Talaromyces proteolyticus]|uniref:Interferon-induced GTP-binding protein Mx2 n=1 Tax=Talaromyces proteolyticus TaxID=1131652 RepID=A0AAD4PYM0_9EURO|nr:interferon-induced GTP-binding protein Mx2 [Talaromyces proteolyticus]KAH8694947.1 interferon-induced GTP-binding protein Mx2 [Talaromyces proteolyticus]
MFRTIGPKDYFTLIDVPGIFRTPTEGITTSNDAKLVMQMVKNYIQDRRTIILAVLPSNADPATQEILTIVKEYDKKGEQTLGVLTKPELVQEESAKIAVRNIVNGKKKPLLGYYLVRNRGPDDKEADYEQLFNEQPWKSLPRGHALKKRLSELLGEIAKREFLALKIKLEDLGPARQTVEKQRLYLATLSRKFEALVRNALDGNYPNNGASQLRLGTHIANLTDHFNAEFVKKSQMRYFQNESTYFKKPEQVFNTDNEIDTDAVLEDIIARKYDFDDPQGNIMGWIKKLYAENRTLELGTFGSGILLNAFQQQSEKWDDMAKAYIASSIAYELSHKYKEVMEHAELLVMMEREQRPFTPNHYFNENLQKARGKRMMKMLESKAQTSFFDVKHGITVTPGKGFVYLEDSENALENKDNFQQKTEDSHDILCAYYKVARKRFVDSIFRQVVEYDLLTGLKSPLAIIDSDWVIKLDAETLETIAGESPTVKQYRASLEKRIEDLKTALEILKK